MLNYGKQDINDEDINAVVDVLKSDFLTQGPTRTKFESLISDIVGSKYCLAVNSATSALHIACLSLDVSKGDKVWTSPISFVASSNCALYCGAEVDFVDIDPITRNICIRKLKKKLEEADHYGLLPKVVIPVHLSGNPCDMLEIKKLSKKYNFKILEDASHALGSKHHHKPIGCGYFSDITVFSFHPVKIITTGEGGAITTNCKDLYSKMSMLSTHGITREREKLFSQETSQWYYEQQFLGFNYRMSDIQAALGISQLSRLKIFIEKRNEIAETYTNFFKNKVQTPVVENYDYSSFHLYIISLPSKTKNRQTEIFEFFKSHKISINKHYIPIYLQPYYQKLGFHKGYCKNAEEYYETSFSLPIYPAMLSSDIEKVMNITNQAIKKFGDNCD